ncbi:predicted protein [Micromonas commoda]|uniref:Uncharacterized protein n=1 Tax=Micromonas commoda (strain RCC299 / NOUM17 / CCMP2709) TaxID=296587 RepID=C1ECE2_MICCC|nr:predicted protein [Micromonas commoda]ACO65887.1 predicted protein [Micromonas commoda]|eukprot:XP_002504629.1 predicted protein [Micromonas commoda]
MARPAAAPMDSMHRTVAAPIYAARRAMGDKAPVSTDWEHATGLELKELQAAAEGKDFFDHYDFLKQPNGTKESPVVVTSSMPYRVVGATDPDDDTIVHWGRVEAGKPPVKIGSEWFVHKAEEPH